MMNVPDETPEHPEAMTVRQLAERTGVPPRRIRYYVSNRLIPPPIGSGRASYYTPEHLERLQQVVALRQVNLGLDEIRERLGAVEEATPARTSSVPRSEQWRRWEIVPGVELHARADLDADTLSAVRVMVGAVRHVLEHGDELDDVDWSEQHE